MWKTFFLIPHVIDRRGVAWKICWSVVTTFFWVLIWGLLLSFADEIHFNLVHSFQNKFILFHQKLNLLINTFVFLFDDLICNYPLGLLLIVSILIKSTVLRCPWRISRCFFLCLNTGICTLLRLLQIILTWCFYLLKSLIIWPNFVHTIFILWTGLNFLYLIRLLLILCRIVFSQRLKWILHLALFILNRGIGKKVIYRTNLKFNIIILFSQKQVLCCFVLKEVIHLNNFLL